MKNYFKQKLSQKNGIYKHAFAHLFADYLHNPNIWHIHRRSFAGGAAIGFFCAFIPFPIQTLTVVTFSILLRVNLSIAILCSLFSNPITIPPIFFFAYALGAKILGINGKDINFEFSWYWISNMFSYIWQPLLLGCFILACFSALISYFLIRFIWRINTINKWKNRRKKIPPPSFFI